MRGEVPFVFLADKIEYGISRKQKINFRCLVAIKS